MHADTGEALLAPLLRDAESFVAPQSPDTLVVDLVALSACLLGSTSPPPPRAGLGEAAQELT